MIFFDHLVVPRLHLLHLRGDLVGDDADDHREHEHAHEHDNEIVVAIAFEFMVKLVKHLISYFLPAFAASKGISYQ